MAEDSKVIEIGDWTLRIREPEGAGPHPVVLLIHGWTGDENSMWIFTPRLPKDALLIAPQALHPSPLGGFGWHLDRSQGWPHVDDLKPAVEALLDLITPENFPTADFSDLRAVGFSQGAALTYTLALRYPDRIRSLAGLAGFMPRGAEDLAAGQPLHGKSVFVAHGARDELVPVEQARQAVGILEQAGARVTYCEDDVGHKLSLTCFKGLETFFKSN